MGDNLDFSIEFLDQSQAAIEIKVRASKRGDPEKSSCSHA